MVNSATPHGTVPVLYNGEASAVIPVKVVLDTPTTPLTIYTPSNSEKYVGLVGLVFGEATTQDLTLISGVTPTFDITIPIPANVAFFKSIGKPIFVCAQGDALRFEAGVAIDELLAYVIEFDRIHID